MRNKKQEQKKLSIKKKDDKKKDQDSAKNQKKSKKDKVAKKKQDKKEDKLVTSLREDSYLQEALYISVDYVRLLKQQKLAQLKIPLLAPSPKDASKAPSP